MRTLDQLDDEGGAADRVQQAVDVFRAVGIARDRQTDPSPRQQLKAVRTFAKTSNFDELLKQLAYGKKQEGAPRGSIKAPLVIGWGRQDRVVLPSQAPRAVAAFPDATLYWFEKCGHFPQWDQTEETIQLILSVTSQARVSVGADRSELSS